MLDLSLLTGSTGSAAMSRVAAARASMIPSFMSVTSPAAGKIFREYPHAGRGLPECMLRLEGKNALITGASTGIGKAIAVRFAQEGANVAINFRSGPDEAEATKVLVHEACLVARNHGCRDLNLQADISKEDQVREMFQKVVAEFGRID